MAQTTDYWPDGLFGLYQFKIDYGHNYTDTEIRDIIDTRGGLVRGTYEAWAEESMYELCPLRQMGRGILNINDIQLSLLKKCSNKSRIKYRNDR